MMIIETDRAAGIVVRWGELQMLYDPVGCWLVWRGRVLARLVVGEA